MAAKSSILKIVIMREYFDQIAAKTKKVEYRDVTPFWTSRLYDKSGKKRYYVLIEFINGYNKDARRIFVRFLGFQKRKGLYYIALGRIIRANK